MTPDEAGEMFERGRRAMRDLALLHAHIAKLRSGVPSGGLPSATTGGGISNPTAGVASVLVDMADEWQSEEKALLAQIEDCKELCYGVGIAFAQDKRYRMVMELYYLLGMEWKQVAALVGISLTTALTMRRAVCDYVAHVGPKAAKQGLGRAEE